MGFSLYERQYLGIHGLLPPAFMTQEQQAYRVMCKLREQPNDLARYVQLSSLQVACFSLHLENRSNCSYLFANVLRFIALFRIEMKSFFTEFFVTM